MLIVSAVIPVQPEKWADFIAAAKACAEATRQETGNLSYTILSDITNSNVYVTFEEWETPEAEAAHMQTGHLKAFIGEIRSYLAGPPAMRRYNAQKLG